MPWTPPSKPAEITESRLIAAILDGTFPIGASLPAERDLAARLGVTRPTLREALQRLGRDGWIEIRHGKPTRVRNYWEEGNLAVLAAIAHYQRNLPADFVPNLLQVRCLLAPAYTRQAVERRPQDIARLVADILRLDEMAGLPDTNQDYTAGDWRLHYQLTIASGNPVFTLILNGFRELYVEMGLRYFASPANRAHSLRFYHALLDCARRADAAAAAALCEQVMRETLGNWERSKGG